MSTYIFSEKELETYTRAVQQLTIIESYFDNIEKLKKKLLNAEKEFENAKELRNRFGMFEDCGESYREEFMLAEKALHFYQSELRKNKKMLKSARRSFKNHKQEINQNVDKLLYDYTIELSEIERKHKKQISKFGGDFFLTVHAVVAHKKKYHHKPMTDDEISIIDFFNHLKKTSQNKNFIRFVRVSIADNVSVLKKSINIYKERNLLFTKHQKAYLDNLLGFLEKAL